MVLFWRYPSAASRFVQASDDEYIRYVKAEYWQNDEVHWIYFMFMNLPVVATAYFGGFQVVIIDVLLLIFVRKKYFTLLDV